MSQPASQPELFTRSLLRACPQWTSSLSAGSLAGSIKTFQLAFRDVSFHHFHVPQTHLVFGAWGWSSSIFFADLISVLPVSAFQEDPLEVQKSMGELLSVFGGGAGFPDTIQHG